MIERTEIPVQPAPRAMVNDASYVDWSSIACGAVVATGIAFVFTTFGAAVGLTMVSPYDGEGSAMAALIAVGLWLLWTTVSSFMAGGYIAGRMRRRIDPATPDEAAIRDGIHGLAVWGVAILLGAFLLGSSADTAVQATSETMTAVATMADDSTSETGTVTANAQPDTQVSEAEAKAAAEAARKYGVVSAFVLAASLMIAAAGAYWAAAMGGEHRDQARVFPRFGRWG